MSYERSWKKATTSTVEIYMEDLPREFSKDTSSGSSTKQSGGQTISAQCASTSTERKQSNHLSGIVNLRISAHDHYPLIIAHVKFKQQTPCCPQPSHPSTSLHSSKQAQTSAPRPALESCQACCDRSTSRPHVHFFPPHLPSCLD